jgi:hypothetical protein
MGRTRAQASRCIESKRMLVIDQIPENSSAKAKFGELQRGIEDERSVA